MGFLGGKCPVDLSVDCSVSRITELHFEQSLELVFTMEDSMSTVPFLTRTIGI